MTFILSNIVVYFHDNFYAIWLVLSTAFIVMLFFVFYLMKKIRNKIIHDIKQIIEYLEAIVDKKYESIIETKHFSEFLQIEVLLKNIVKRVHKREK